MRKYNSKTSKTINVVKDYLDDTNNQIGRCKYSDSIIVFDNSVDIWKPIDNQIESEYINYNDWNIDLETVVQSSASTSGFEAKLRTGIKIKDRTPFSLNKSDWRSTLQILAHDNVVDTSKLVFDRIYYGYDSSKLVGQIETLKLINILAPLCSGDSEFTKHKLLVMLNTFVKRALGRKTDYVVTLVSEEGSGKSEFLSEHLFESFKKYKLINSNAVVSEDEWKFKSYFSSKIAMVIEEKSIGKKAHESVKNYTSMTDYTLKDKGSNVEKDKKSRSMMFFNTNNKQFIPGDDKTNRRFISFDLSDNKLYILENNKVKWKFEDVDFEKLWAEQYHLYITNNPPKKLDWNRLAKDNTQYLVLTNFNNKDNSVIEAMNENVIDISNGVEKWVTASDILAILKIYDSELVTNKNDSNEICRVLKKISGGDKKTKCDIKIPSVNIGTLSDHAYYENNRTRRYKIKVNQSILDELSDLNSKKIKKKPSLPVFLNDDKRELTNQDFESFVDTT